MKNRALILTFFIFAVVALAVIGSLLKARSDQAKRLEIQGREIIQFSAEKDSIALQLGEATQSISTVYDQVSNIAGAVAVTKTLENIDNFNYKSQVASKLSAISDIVTGYKEQMKATENRINMLKERNTGFAQRVVVLEKTLAGLKKTIEQQEIRITQLTSELELTRAERDQYKAEALAKAKKLLEREEQLTESQNELSTAYYIIGTIDDLSKAGYIEKKGSVLVFGGAWKPSDSLQVDDKFTKIDIRTMTEIPMTTKFYRIVSPHDQKLLRPQPNEAQSTPYTIKITRPDRFWTQSKVLIIAED